MEMNKVMASPSQRLQWFANKSDKRNQQALKEINIQLKKPTELSRIHQAFEVLIDQFEILRTSLHEDELSTLWQNIATDAPCHMLVCPDKKESTPELLELTKELVNKGGVIVLGDSELPCELRIYILAACFDTGSLIELVKTLLIELDGQLQEQAPIQYQNVSAWFNNFLLEDELEDARAFWSDFKVDTKRTKRFSLAHYQKVDDAQLISKIIDLSNFSSLLNTFCEQHDLSLDNVLAASLRMTVMKYGDDRQLARIVDSRSEEALKNMIGGMSRSIPSRHQCAETLLESAYQEAEYLAQINDYIECYYDEHSRFAFSYEHLSLDPSVLEKVTLGTLSLQSESSQVAMMSVAAPDCLSMHIQFDSSFISEQALQLFINDWLLILSKELGAPKELERNTKRYQLSGPDKSPSSSFDNVVAWFDSLEDVSEQVVIEHQTNSQINYEALQVKANQYACFMKEYGVAKGDKVALHLPRSIDFIALVLATLKVGACYVPIDTSYPVSRVNDILEQSQSSLCFAVQPNHEIDAKLIDITHLDMQNYSGARIYTPIADDDLAYVLFTSGSTGKPKGVEISHGALQNHMHWMINEFSFSAQDTFLQRTSLSFDASIWEYWAALLVGAKLVIAPDEANYQLDMLADIVTQGRVTRMQLVPSQLQVLRTQTDTPLQLRTLFLGGEALSTQLAKSASEAYQCEVVNLYGPTECCIQTVFSRYSADLLTEQVPIGKLIDNVNAIVLKEDGNFAQLGEVGELCLSGACLFKGYVANPELTDEVMLSIDGQRYYRTGDSVQILHDGQLLYVTRLDQQIKLNGQRIELDEIRSVAKLCADVHQAIVLYDKDHRSLCLFVLGAQCDSKRISEHLSAYLPEYMIPKSIVKVPEFPSLSNGKVDNKALLALAQRQTSELVLASNDTEVKLVSIWQSVLERSQAISVEDDFFALGGHSLLGMALVRQINEHFNVNITVRDLFENPTVRKLSLKIAEAETVSASQIQPVDRCIDLPVSFAQQRLWFVEQMNGASAQYNMPVAIKIEGDLNVEALCLALKNITNKHEILRTEYYAKDAQCYQLIKADNSFKVDVVDLTTFDNCQRQSVLDEKLYKHATTPFDLASANVLRASLFKLDDGLYTLSFVVHHIAADGISLAILLKEFAQQYSAIVAGQDTIHNGLAVQYADFAHWQRAEQSTDILAAQKQYWVEQLKDAPKVHSLAIDKLRPDFPSGLGKVIRTSLDKYKWQEVVAIAQSLGATPFMLVHAVMAAVIARFSNRMDVVIGTPIAGRTQPETQDLIGLFINNVTLRTQLDNVQTMADLIQQSKQTIVAAYDNQDVSFDEIVDALELPRSTSFSPIFQVMLSANNMDMTMPQLSNVSMQPYSFDSTIIKYDLELNMAESEDGLSLSWNYSTDLFFEKSIEQLAQSMLNVLNNLSYNLATSWRSLAILSTKQLADVQEVAKGHVKPAQHFHFLALWDANLANYANNIAVECAGQTLTYQALDQRAEHLARTILAMQSSDVVPFMLNPSCEILVAMLACFKAGKAYLPIDPNYPDERIDYILQDSGATLLLADASCEQRSFKSSIEILRVDIKTIEHAIETRHSASLKGDVTAYVIYTSGSTGEPKGVAVSHHALIDYINYASSQYMDETYSGSVVSSSISFDATVTTLFAPLVHGKEVCIIAGDQETKLATLSHLLFEEWNTWLFKLTPAHLELLAKRNTAQLTSEIAHTLVVGGEPLATHTLLQWQCDTLPKSKIINEYGPTETTVGATAWSADSEQDIALLKQSRSVPIGKPLFNTKLLVLDEHQQRVPYGVEGELYIAGAGVASGYLNRPELTESRFINIEGDKYYRTGDLVRYCSNGNLEFLGRNDEQVKVNGYRIEPGEIEHRLVQIDHVQDAIVQLNGEGNLTAYLVLTKAASEEDEQTVVRAISERLKSQLPDFMQPKYFAIADKFTLTANGKIDKDALRTLPVVVLRNQYRGAQTELQQTLVDIWQQVLGRSSISTTDNFFELGGDSILSVQVVNLAKKAGIDFTIRELFQYQTIEGIASFVEQNDAYLEARNDRSETEPLPLFPIQRDYLKHSTGNIHLYNQSVLLSVPVNFDTQALQSVLAALFKQHAPLRLRFAPDNTETAHFLASEQIDLQAVFAHEEISSEQSFKDTLKRIANRYQGSLDIYNGPLFKCVYIQHAQSPRLLIVVHHLIIDGVSWRTLLTDMDNGYQQAIFGKEIDLGVKPSQLYDWSDKLSALAVSDELKEEKAYWLAQLQSSKGLKVDQQVSERLTHQDSHSAYLNLSEQHTDILFSQVEDNTSVQTSELILAALVQALCKWNASNEITIDIEGHGRESISTGTAPTDCLGWFSTIHPLCFEVSESLVLTLNEVKSTVRRVPNKGVGFGVLRDLVEDKEIVNALGDASADVLFNYLGQFDQINETVATFKTATEQVGDERDSLHSRSHKLEVMAMVADNRLGFVINYSNKQYNSETIQSLLDTLQNVLEQFVALHKNQELSVLTPSDFPLAQVTQKQLDTWQAQGSVQKIYPATGMQESLIFHSSLDSSAYALQMFPILKGELNLPLFKKAWQSVIDSHDIFRTAFKRGSSLLQVVYEDVQLPWQEVDLSALSPQEQQARFEQYRSEDKQAGFDFEQPPLQRITLFKLSDERHQMLWTHHHAILDGWSTPLVYQQVISSYQNLLAGLAINLQVDVHFEDYMVWLAKQDTQSASKYWQAYLQSCTAPTPLMLEKLPTSERGPKELWDGVTKAQTEQLIEFAKKHRVTLNTLLQFAWSYLLHYYSGEDNVTFGATVSGRPSEIENIDTLVGVLINTLPVSINWDRDCPIATMLGQLQQQFQSSIEHGYLPLQEIQRLCPYKGKRIFDSVILFQNFPLDSAIASLTSNDGVSLEVESSGINEQTNFGLTISAAVNDGLDIRLSYSGEQYSTQTAARILAQLVNVLTQLPSSQNTNELSVLTDAERAALLEWTGHDVEFTSEHCVYEVFEQISLQQGDSPAIYYEGDSLSYEELNTRANQLAHYLISKGVQTGDLVGLCLDRSLEMVVGMLGILKAGAAYVPLDPSYPIDRLDYMIEDAGVQVVVTKQSLLAELAFDEQILVLMDDDFRRLLLDKQPTINVPRSETLTAQSLAYVIYTSGSTGQPKGVMLAHKGAVNLAQQQITQFNVTANSRVLHFASLSFDAGTWDWLMGLLSGACLYICPQECRQSAELLSAYLVDNQVTHATLPPALLPHLDFDKQYHFTSLIVAGEACEQSIAWKWADKYNLFNAYGPTEGTVCASVGLVTPNETIHIGKPLANVKLYVLDEEQKPVPVGASGELYIGGAGVAIGYWNKPELSEQAFSVDPYSTQTDARMYRTGDRVRILPDEDGNPCNLLFLGRNDDQVKIRGFRIELSEVNSHLAQAAQIRESIVVVDSDGAENRLVAYFTSDSDDTSEQQIEQLRAHLQSTLPDYMMPSAFMHLEQMPLTANGKIDKAKLPEVEMQSNTEYVAPRNDKERTLAGIWCQLLGLEKVGIHDNFFWLGGDSILTIQVVAKAKEQGIYLATKDIFDAPTIAQLAAVEQHVSESSQLVATGHLELLPMQQQFLDNATGNYHHHNQSLLLVAPNDLSKTSLEQAVAALVQRHDALNVRFYKNAQQWHATHTQASSWLEQAVVIETLNEEPLDERFSARCEAYQQSLDIEHGPTFRLVYFAGKQHSRLLLVAHHLVTDGVSWRILLSDLEQAIIKIEQQQSVVLAAKTASMQACAKQLRDYVSTHDLEKEKAYWLNVYADGYQGLPVDKQCDHRIDHTSVRSHSLTLTKETTQQLISDCPTQFRAKINELLLAAIYKAVRSWSQQDVVRIVMEGHGRNDVYGHLDTTQTVGWFTHTYPVSLHTASHDTEIVINHVKSQYRAISLDGAGHDLLQYIAQDTQLRQVCNSSPAALLFNYLGQFDQVVNAQSMFSMAPEYAGADADVHRALAFPLAINGYVSDGQLSLTVQYSTEQYLDDTVAQLLAHVERAVAELVELAQQRDKPLLIAADFPLANVSDGKIIDWQNIFAIKDIYAATGTQSGMFFHSELDSRAYVTQMAFVLEGVLDSSKFQQAWQHLVDEHGVFRTALMGYIDQLNQVVVEQATLPWVEADWGHFTEQEQQAQLQQYMLEDKQRGFDFSKPPLQRIAVFKLTDDKHQVVWTHHHAILDGWCQPLVYREVMQNYHTLETGDVLQTQLQPSYKRYVEWLANKSASEGRNFWKAYLADFDSMTAIGDMRIDNSQRHGPAEYESYLSTEQTASLEHLAKSTSITFNSLLQLAWGYILQHYNDTQDVVFGTVVSGRPAEIAGIDEMLGVFINTVPVRVKFSQDQSLSSVLQQLQKQFVDVNEHAYLPLPQIQACSGVDRHEGLFDTLLVLENYPLDAALNYDQDNQQRAFKVSNSKTVEHTDYGITLMIEQGEQLHITCSYQQSRYDQQFIALLMECFTHVLSQLPQVGCVDELVLMPDTQSQQVVSAQNALLTSFDKGSIQQRFAQVATANAHRPALSVDGVSLTYQQLDELSTQFACALLTQGVKHGDIVALIMPRSLELIVSMLGIVKAGCVYLPVDAAFPISRIVETFKESKPALVIVKSAIDTQLSDTKQLTYQAVLDVAIPDASLPNGDSKDVAYVTYTSGSTGIPKGIMVKQSGIMRLVTSGKLAGLSEQTVMLHASSIAFDAATFEIWGALLNGGQLVLYPEPELSFGVINQLIIAHKIDTMWLTAALFEQWSYLVPDIQWPTWILAGGDVVSPIAVRRVYEKLPQTKVINGYGPTENTTFTACHEISPQHDTLQAIPLGKAIAGTCNVVLDSKQRLQPLGAPGELYTAGFGVMKGYLRQPELNNATLLELTIDSLPTQCYYRTGDRVCLNGEGQLVFMGRCDNQVKIRGFRVEPAELHRQLMSIDLVKQAYVRVVGSDNDKKLVAYVVTQSSLQGDIAASIRHYLQLKVPAFLMPAATVIVDELPTKSSGKVDESLLPDAVLQHDDSEYVAPESELEVQLCEIWQQVLQVERVGCEDDFFSLGGHSLLLMRVVNEVQSQTGVELDMASAFRLNTVQRQAEGIRQLQANDIDASRYEQLTQKNNNEEILL